VASGFPPIRRTYRVTILQLGIGAPETMPPGAEVIAVVDHFAGDLIQLRLTDQFGNLDCGLRG
jgi:hypothetical protein